MFVNSLILLLAAITAFVAFACFALAMPRHWREASRRASITPPHPGRLRSVGIAALGGCLALCIWRDGAGFGSVLWVMLTSAAALVVSLLLSWRPQVLLLFYRGHR